MIKIQTLAKKFEDSLNNGLTGDISYKIFVDTGKFRKAVRKKNKVTTYINGIYSNSSSDLSETNTGLTVATMTNAIEFVIPCKDTEEDIRETVMKKDGTIEEGELIAIGNDTFIQQIRDRIDKITADNIFETVTEDGVSYSISAAFTVAVSGARQQLAELGDCFTFTIYGYYNVILNGDNSKTWEVYLDSERIPYTNSTFNRTATQEATIYSNRGDSISSRTITSAFALAIECPSIVGKFSKVLKNYLANGETSEVHVLTCVIGVETKFSKIVGISRVQATASGILNAGFTFQFTENKEEYGVISFGSDYHIARFTGEQSGLFVANEKEDFFEYCPIIKYSANNFKYEFFYPFEIDDDGNPAYVVNVNIKSGDLLIFSTKYEKLWNSFYSNRYVEMIQ